MSTEDIFIIASLTKDNLGLYNVDVGVPDNNRIIYERFRQGNKAVVLHRTHIGPALGNLSLEQVPTKLLEDMMHLSGSAGEVFLLFTTGV